MFKGAKLEVYIYLGECVSGFMDLCSDAMMFSDLQLPRKCTCVCVWCVDDVIYMGHPGSVDLWLILRVHH